MLSKDYEKGLLPKHKRKGILSKYEINRIFENTFHKNFYGKKTLFIVLGLLGDFDSFEYVQSLIPYLNRLSKANIEPFIVGIANEEAKDYFCKYTLLPKKCIYLLFQVP